MYTLNTSANKMQKQIMDYCRARTYAGRCSEDDCEFCPVEGAYEMARIDKEFDPDTERKSDER